MVSVTENRSVALQDNEALFVSVIVGNGQLGGTYIEVSRGPDKIVVAKAADITNLFVGTGKTLRGFALLVRTAVVDVNPHTDWTIITHRIKRGNAAETNESFTKEADTQKPGSDGIVLYTITYTFN
ncbi:hypothetical protein [Hymenobacter sp.]|uniref:hypothetical protein n=1 Tax=Hymenobacter sp. TaxID=1898978 RepID=UPI00286C6910|nr:hypothetical protein [Hymenobacter sp.]